MPSAAGNLKFKAPLLSESTKLHGFKTTIQRPEFYGKEDLMNPIPALRKQLARLRGPKRTHQNQMQQITTPYIAIFRNCSAKVPSIGFYSLLLCHDASNLSLI
jgi:hypothetical protein